jgi:3-hydroxypropanoate dehydrogenase
VNGLHEKSIVSRQYHPIRDYIDKYDLASYDSWVMNALADKSHRALDRDALNALFHEARSANGFLPIPVGSEILQELVDATKMGPTAMNALPLRIVFVTSQAARERLKPLVMPGNVGKVESAPVTAILARDLYFYEELPKLFPHAPQQSLDHVKANAENMSLQNATLQAGYFILAARALGLDAGPMGGFDSNGVDAEFFPDGAHRSILLVTLGYGDDGKLFPRNPRLDFAEIASII